MQSFQLIVEGVTCPSCMDTINGAIDESVDFRIQHFPLARRAQLSFSTEVSRDAVVSQVHEAGFDVFQPECVEARPARSTWGSIFKILLPLIVGLTLMLLGWFGLLPALLLPVGQWVGLAIGVITLIVMLYSGWKYYVGTWHALKSGQFNMNTLITLGSWGAWGISMFVVIAPTLFPAMAVSVFFPAAVMILAMINLGDYFKQAAQRRMLQAQLEIANGQLARLDPGMIQVLDANTVKLEQVEKEQQLVIPPGGLIPVKAQLKSNMALIVSGQLDGEFRPTQYTHGNQLMACASNASAENIVVIAKENGKEGELYKEIQQIKQGKLTQSDRANGESVDQSGMAWVDGLSSYFVILVIIAAVLTLLGWLFFAHAPCCAMQCCLSVCVCACPCVFGLAATLPLAVGLYIAFKKHIILKDAQTLVALKDTKMVVFDKTGTLTSKHLQVKEGGAGLLPEHLSSIAALEKACLAQYPENLYAKAFGRLTFDSDYTVDCLEVCNNGLRGVVNGQVFSIGNQSFISARPSGQQMQAAKRIQQGFGRTISWVSVNGVCVGFVSFESPIKSGAKAAVQALKDRGIAVKMLTGDNEIVAKYVAEQIGIEENNVFSEKSPSEKANLVEAWQARCSGHVLMVGDGRNDQQAFEKAGLGVAMSADEFVAAHADVTLRGDPVDLTQLIDVAQSVYDNLNQNMAWAFIVNVVSVVLASGILFPVFGVMLSPVTASMIMGFSGLFVIFNVMRLSWILSGYFEVSRRQEASLSVARSSTRLNSEMDVLVSPALVKSLTISPINPAKTTH